MAPHAAHGTRHGGPAHGDALDVYVEQSDLLKAALADWDATRLDQSPAPGESVAPAKYDNGTLGKVILEHTALRLAAQRDIARALTSAGRHDIEGPLTAQVERLAPLITAVERLSRGVNPVSLAGSDQFLDALTNLRSELQPALLHPSPAPQELADALGEHRRELHSAKYVRRHAPTAPAPDKWYDKVPLLLRLHTAFDRGRGFPWAESSPSSSRTVSDRYDRDVQ